MAREEIERGYYKDIHDSKNFVDVRTSIQAAVYTYLDTVFFGNERRMVYSDPEYAFRARLEALAKGIDGDDIFINNLQLPFGCYYLDKAPELIKSVSASEWNGYYDEDLEQYLHFYSINQSIKVILWFDRTGDAYKAFKIATNESHSQAPTRFIEKVYWRNKTLPFPIYITVKKVIAGQESFTNAEWLKRSNLYPVVLELMVESVELHINKGKNLVQLPFKWHNTGNVDTWMDGEQEYYTQASILSFAHEVYDATLIPPRVVTESARANASALTYIPYTDLDDETAKVALSVLPNRGICEMVKGSFMDSTLVYFSKLKYVEEKTTIDEKGMVTAYIDLAVHKGTWKYWKACEVIVPTRENGNLWLKNCKDQYLEIDGLHPNSTYTIYFVTEDTGGNFNTVPLEFTTPVWKKETVAVMDGTIESIDQRENNDPTKVPLHGLIDLNEGWEDMEL